MSVTCSTGCGTGASRICTKGQMSAMCSKKCRSSPTWPRGTPRQGGREPPWGRGASGTPPCGSTRTSPPALSFLCPREEWCLNSDRAIATAIRSWRRNERRRRSLRRRALPVPPPASSRSTSTIYRYTFLTQKATTRQRLGGNAWWWWWWAREGGERGEGCRYLR